MRPGSPAVNDVLELVDEVCAHSTSRGSLIHGEEHWRRVATLGLDLTPDGDAPRAAARAGVDRLVIVLFGLFHDSRRINDGSDPEHGRRGAALARELLCDVDWLAPEQLALLERACVDHTNGSVTDDPTIGACWDADRLDLVRLAITPNPAKLSTPAARRPEATWHARELLRRAPEWRELCHRL